MIQGGESGGNRVLGAGRNRYCISHYQNRKKQKEVAEGRSEVIMKKRFILFACTCSREERMENA